MEVDKKLGMSLDALIKENRGPRKPRSDASDKKTGKGVKKQTQGKLGVRRSLGKKNRESTDSSKQARNVARPTKTSNGAVVQRNRRRVSGPSKTKTSSSTTTTVKNNSGRRSNQRQQPTSNDSTSFARRVVVKKGPNAPESRRVKVTNVPYDLTWKDIKGAFTSVGVIERCDVDHGEAQILFKTANEAKLAVQTYNGGDMNGRKIKAVLMA